MLHHTTKKLAAKNPKTLFFVDCVGALLSVVLLAIVLADLQHIFGIPRNTLYFLAMFPCLFAVYDLNCIVRDRLKVIPFLKTLAIMNFSYCVLSLVVAIYRYQDLTVLGWIYILLEITIVSILAKLEFNVAKVLANLVP
jgi:hypothetical protein